MANDLIGNGTETQGWTPSPDGRGTYKILSSSVLVIVLCVWSSVYPNIPAPSDSFWIQFRDKLGLALIGLLGPEFLLGIAVGQKSSALRSVEVMLRTNSRDVNEN
jgi:hypothetical protein